MTDWLKAKYTNRSSLLVYCQRCVQDFSLRAKPEKPKAASGGGVLGEGHQPPPHQLGGMGSDVSPPKGFPLFSALRMASPGTIILFIVDYHAAIGGGETQWSPLRTLPFTTLLQYIADSLCHSVAMRITCRLAARRWDCCWCCRRAWCCLARGSCGLTWWRLERLWAEFSPTSPQSQYQLVSVDSGLVRLSS